MKSLTEADITLLDRFAEELSTPAMPVRVKHEPPHLIVHFKKGGQQGLTDAQHGLLLSRYATLEELKADIKSHAGVV